MAHTTVATESIDALLDRLARFTPVEWPVISLYLNLQADQHGKDNFASFVKKELLAPMRDHAPKSPGQVSIDSDARRIQSFLAAEVPPSANGLALFACSGLDGFFEAVLLAVPIAHHRLTVGHEPHLYPLERALDDSPRHAVVLADSHAARIFVFGYGRTIASETVEGPRIRRSSGGGWSQTRYQRHVETLQAGHARELANALDRAVREATVEHIVLAGDDVNIPLVRRELSNELAAKVIDTIKIEAHASEHEIQEAAAAALRRYDEAADRAIVAKTIDDYRAGGLAAAGLFETTTALTNGQVRELYLTAMETFTGGGVTLSADELVRRARQTSVRVRFIEDVTLLAGVEGIAASLRFLVDAPGRRQEGATT